ncbi:MAG: hypothetical protein LBJ13_01310 [Puniceicoccales bacterium]|jgi:hypothetical protein|nr:hypothetical protein [Puniceicoccales bacterium]
MLKKISKIIAGGIFFLGSEIMAEPLKNYKDALDFVKSVHNGGSDQTGLVGTLRDTIGNEEIPIQTRVYILNEIEENFTERYIELEIVINGGIQSLLEERERNRETLPEEYGQMNMEMKLAHVLWESQTEEFRGITLRSNYGANCLESICRILRRQKTNNKAFADALHQQMENVLKANNIEMGQFEP